MISANGKVFKVSKPLFVPANTGILAVDTATALYHYNEAAVTHFNSIA